MLQSLKSILGVSVAFLRHCSVITRLRVTRVRGGAVSLCEWLSDALEVLKVVVPEATVAVSASRRVEVGRLPMVQYKA